MEITKEHFKKAGKAAGIGVVGAGIGAGAVSQTDNGPTQNEYQNLQEKADNLQSKVAELEKRPTQDDLDELKDKVDNFDDRPTKAEYQALQKKLAESFTQEEVNEMMEREDVLEYLPVIADEDVEIESAGDLKADSDEAATDGRLDDDLTGISPTFDSNDLEGEEFDEVRAYYGHDDGHDYEAVAREFEDSEDADEYEEEVRQAVEVEDFDETIKEDAAVIRDGDTVVYLYGDADTDEYHSYDFEAFTGQY